MVLDQQVVVGGGTSQSAPIWAGLTALMNESLLARGSEQVGDLNPLLYKVATPSPGFVPAFHDISLGGNAIMPASTTGYDMVTGLGTPNVANLVRNILLLRAVA